MIYDIEIEETIFAVSTYRVKAESAKAAKAKIRQDAGLSAERVSRIEYDRVMNEIKSVKPRKERL
jgi:hypothetical protein